MSDLKAKLGKLCKKKYMVESDLVSQLEAMQEDSETESIWEMQQKK